LAIGIGLAIGGFLLTANNQRPTALFRYVYDSVEFVLNIFQAGYLGFGLLHIEAGGIV
jgi:hypothetical protein